jgi:hypothetical protein
MMEIFNLYVFSWLFRVVGTTYGLGIVLIVVTFFLPGLSETVRKWFLIAGVALLSGGSFFWVAFHQGEAFAVQKMAAREAETVQRVQEKTKEVDNCNGGVDWDVTTGQCISH